MFGHAFAICCTWSLASLAPSAAARKSLLAGNSPRMPDVPAGLLAQ
ncbi:hypothetical protein BZL30_7881 [Mycobacterium kansasii]|uniref:Uncharacterized protein n=1 Tax=Mycobacterium kansasii TaxID=1768 RepID=A0A1V3WKJ4_MYCKA|nr:hypothetical protein BZL30_7881 [Mycobacterium kansasii]